MKKNEPNSPTKFVFWLVAEEIPKLRGISPYGDHEGDFESQEGSKTSKNLKNNQKSKEIEKNMSESIIKVSFLADSTVT